MKTTFRPALLAAVAAAAVALPAWAQTATPPPAASTPPAAANQGPRGPGALFDEMDANKDSRVTWDEAWAFVQRRFNAADANRDGGLTRQEADALRPASRRGGGQQGGGGNAAAPTADQAARQSRFGDVVFRGIDANRDGRVTLDEVRPVIEARFRGLDANADNAVSRDELPQRRQGGGPRPNNGGGQGQGGQGGQAPAAPAR
jgi:EF hand domain-containing protein